MKKTNKKIQAAQPGAVIAPYAQAGNFLGTAVSGVSDEGSDGDFAGSMLSGAASGAGIGSMFGPIVAGVGTLVGGLTGWFRAKKRKEQLQAMQDRKDYQKNYSVARANTSSAMANYYGSHDTAMTMKEGGVAGYSPVYVNDGETIMHPDGTVEYVPEKGRKTDSVLKWLPVGSHVYGGLTEPATGQKFQDIAHNMYKPTKKDSKGRYAEGSKQANIAIERLGKLFQVQQGVSEQKGIKPKYKNLDVQAADTGTKVKKAVLDELTRNSLSRMKADADTYMSKNDAENDVKISNFYDSLVMKDDVNKRETKLRKDLMARADERTRDTITASDVISGITSLTPVAYNFLQGTRDAEYEAPEYNMNAYPAISQLQNRYNIGRVIRDVNNAANIGYYNVNTMGNSTGAGMAQRVAIANNARRGIEDAYAKYNEVETGLGAQRAELLNSLGQQDASARVYANDINAKNRAARRAFTTTAAEGFSKWGQNRALMANQKNRDLSILPYLRDFLSYGSTNQYVA